MRARRIRLRAYDVSSCPPAVVANGAGRRRAIPWMTCTHTSSWFTALFFSSFFEFFRFFSVSVFAPMLPRSSQRGSLASLAVALTGLRLPHSCKFVAFKCYMLFAFTHFAYQQEHLKLQRPLNPKDDVSGVVFLQFCCFSKPFVLFIPSENANGYACTCIIQRVFAFTLICTGKKG